MNEEKLIQALSSIAIEEYRLGSVLEAIFGKLSLDDKQRYMSQFSWHSKRVKRILDSVDISIIDFSGQTFDPGLPIIPINIDEFEKNDELRIEQMLEPVVMKSGDVLKTGTAILGKAEK